MTEVLCIGHAAYDISVLVNSFPHFDSGDGYRSLPAFPARVLDTTAAGDIFHGAFAYGLAMDMPLVKALKWASLAASISVRKWGGRPSIPTLNEVKSSYARTQ